MIQQASLRELVPLEILGKKHQPVRAFVQLRALALQTTVGVLYCWNFLRVSTRLKETKTSCKRLDALDQRLSFLQRHEEIDIAKKSIGQTTDSCERSQVCPGECNRVWQIKGQWGLMGIFWHPSISY